MCSKGEYVDKLKFPTAQMQDTSTEKGRIR